MKKTEFSYTRIDICLKELVRVTKIDIEPIYEDIDNALGMIVYEDIISPINIPPYDRSAVDGYAICSDAVTSASPNNPIPLILKDRTNEINCSEATSVSTGDRLPLGADAVVMIEDTYTDNIKKVVYVTRSVPKYFNVSRTGEDIRHGDIIAERGRLLRPWHIAAIAAIGLRKIKLFKPIRVGVITIGSEIRDSAEGIKVYEKGGVIDVTSKLILASLKEYRFITSKWYGIVPDDTEKIAEILQQSLMENDIVITSGGTGPGNYDVTFNALSILGKRMKVEVISRGIAMRPGRPTSIAVIDNKPIFMLSGFPVAAYIAIRVLVIPFIIKVLNIKGAEPIEIPAILTKRAVGSVGYDVFARIKAYRCGDSICAEPLAIHGSGILKTLLDSNAILHINHDLEGYDKGEKVWIQIL